MSSTQGAAGPLYFGVSTYSSNARNKPLALFTTAQPLAAIAKITDNGEITICLFVLFYWVSSRLGDEQLPEHLKFFLVIRPSQGQRRYAMC